MRQVYILVVMIVASLFFVSISQAADATAWNGTKWGMSKEQLVNLFKDQIVHLDSIETFGPSGLYADIGLNDYKIGNYLYKVRFLMDSSSHLLSQINISSVDKPTKARYYILEKMLVGKYGQWAYKSEDNTPKERISRRVMLDRSENIKAVWYVKNTAINLTYLNLGDGIKPILSLCYKRKGSEVDDNL